MSNNSTKPAAQAVDIEAIKARRDAARPFEAVYVKIEDGFSTLNVRHDDESQAASNDQRELLDHSWSDIGILLDTVEAQGLGVTPEVAQKLLALRHVIARMEGTELQQEAWHILYKIADPEVVSLTPWAELERIAALRARAAPDEQKS